MQLKPEAQTVIRLGDNFSTETISQFQENKIPIVLVFDPFPLLVSSDIISWQSMKYRLLNGQVNIDFETSFILLPDKL